MGHSHPQTTSLWCTVFIISFVSSQSISHICPPQNSSCTWHCSHTNSCANAVISCHSKCKVDCLARSSCSNVTVISNTSATINCFHEGCTGSPIQCISPSCNFRMNSSSSPSITCPCTRTTSCRLSGNLNGTASSFLCLAQNCSAPSNVNIVQTPSISPPICSTIPLSDKKPIRRSFERELRTFYIISGVVFLLVFGANLIQALDLAKKSHNQCLIYIGNGKNPLSRIMQYTAFECFVDFTFLVIIGALPYRTLSFGPAIIVLSGVYVWHSWIVYNIVSVFTELQTFYAKRNDGVDSFTTNVTRAIVGWNVFFTAMLMICVGFDGLRDQVMPVLSIVQNVGFCVLLVFSFFAVIRITRVMSGHEKDDEEKPTAPEQLLIFWSVLVAVRILQYLTGIQAFWDLRVVNSRTTMNRVTFWVSEMVSVLVILYFLGRVEGILERDGKTSPEKKTIQKRVADVSPSFEPSVPRVSWNQISSNSGRLSPPSKSLKTGTGTFVSTPPSKPRVVISRPNSPGSSSRNSPYRSSSRRHSPDLRSSRRHKSRSRSRSPPSRRNESELSLPPPVMQSKNRSVTTMTSISSMNSNSRISTTPTSTLPQLEIQIVDADNFTVNTHEKVFYNRPLNLNISDGSSDYTVGSVPSVDTGFQIGGERRGSETSNFSNMTGTSILVHKSREQVEEHLDVARKELDLEKIVRKTAEVPNDIPKDIVEHVRESEKRHQEKARQQVRRLGSES